MDSINDKCYRSCRNKYHQTIEYKCEYVIKLKSFRKNEIVNLRNGDKSMDLFEINKKITVDREIGFILNQILKLTLDFFQIYQIQTYVFI